MPLNGEGQGHLVAPYLSEKFGGDRDRWAHVIALHAHRLTGSTPDEVASQALSAYEQTFGKLQPTPTPRRDVLDPANPAASYAPGEAIDAWDQAVLDETKRRIARDEQMNAAGESRMPGPRHATMGDAITASKRRRDDARDAYLTRRRDVR